MTWNDVGLWIGVAATGALIVYTLTSGRAIGRFSDEDFYRRKRPIAYWAMTTVYVFMFLCLISAALHL